jgi:hypothetical protein
VYILPLEWETKLYTNKIIILRTLLSTICIRDGKTNYWLNNSEHALNSINLLSSAISLGFDSWQCRTFLFATMCRPVLRPNQPPIQRIWALFSGVKWGMKLTTHLHLVPKLRMHRVTSTPPCLHGMVLSQAPGTTLCTLDLLLSFPNISHKYHSNTFHVSELCAMQYLQPELCFLT